MNLQHSYHQKNPSTCQSRTPSPPCSINRSEKWIEWYSLFRDTYCIYCKYTLNSLLSTLKEINSNSCFLEILSTVLLSVSILARIWSSFDYHFHACKHYYYYLYNKYFYMHEPTSISAEIWFCKWNLNQLPSNIYNNLPEILHYNIGFSWTEDIENLGHPIHKVRINSIIIMHEIFV